MIIYHMGENNIGLGFNESSINWYQLKPIFELMEKGKTRFFCTIKVFDFEGDILRVGDIVVGESFGNFVESKILQPYSVMEHNDWTDKDNAGNPRKRTVIELQSDPTEIKPWGGKINLCEVGSKNKSSINFTTTGGVSRYIELPEDVSEYFVDHLDLIRRRIEIQAEMIKDPQIKDLWKKLQGEWSMLGAVINTMQIGDPNADKEIGRRHDIIKKIRREIADRLKGLGKPFKK